MEKPSFTWFDSETLKLIAQAASENAKASPSNLQSKEQANQGERMAQKPLGNHAEARPAPSYSELARSILGWLSKCPLLATPPTGN